MGYPAYPLGEYPSAYPQGAYPPPVGPTGVQPGPYPSSAYPQGAYPPPAAPGGVQPGPYPSSGYPQGAYPPPATSGGVQPGPNSAGSVGVQPGQDQANMGGVSFEITPSTAQLFVDGSQVGTAGQFGPTTQPLGLTSGHHRIEIRAPGYQTMSFDVDIVAGQVIPYKGVMER
jgi:hypothetical protein